MVIKPKGMVTHCEPYVKQSVWEAKFKLSVVKAGARSTQAFKDYLRVDSFEELCG